MSYKQGDEIHIEDDDASAGEKTGHMRWILAISLLAAVVILSAIWMFGAFTQGDTEEEITMREQPQTADEDSPVADLEGGSEAGDIDGVIGDDDNDVEEIEGSTEMQDGIEVIENE